MGRLRFMAMWAALMFESVVYLFVPSCIAIQPSARYLVGRRLMRLAPRLTHEERSAIKWSAVGTGLSCIPAFLGLGFGMFGTRRPREVFCANWNSVKTIIVQRRLRKSCPVCMCGYEYCHDVYVTSCMHCFHAGCIAPWLQRKKECPVCRGSM